MKTLSGWIFDLDGTLTEPTHDFDFIRKRLGVPLGKHILEYSQSIPNEESIPLLNKLSSLEQSVIKDTQIAEGAYSLIKLLHCVGEFSRHPLTANPGPVPIDRRAAAWGSTSTDLVRGRARGRARAFVMLLRVPIGEEQPAC